MRTAPDSGKVRTCAPGAVFTVSYDYIVDAIDLVSCKLDLIETALARGIPILSAMGNREQVGPILFRVADISKTEGCPWPGSSERS